MLSEVPVAHRLGALCYIQVRTVLAYRANYLMSIAAVLMHIWLLRVVWTAVYQDRGAVDGVSLATMIAYSTLASVQSWLLNPWEFSLIPARVREGRVAVDLVRPVGFVSQVVAGQVGRTAATLPFVVVLLPLAVLVGGAEPPASPTVGLLYAASLLLAYLIATLLSVIVGMLAFWTMEVSGIFVVYRMVSLFLSGALVPLWFMPGALRGVAGALPFQAMTYTPMAVYLGQLPPWSAIGTQAVWVLVLWWGTRLVWSRALRRVVIQGG